MDWKQFKKVRSNEHFTTLQHADGHQVHIVHKALSPDMMKGLQAMDAEEHKEQEPEHFADGGQAEPQQLGNYSIIPGQESQAAVDSGAVIDAAVANLQNEQRAAKGIAPVPEMPTAQAVVAPASVEQPMVQKASFDGPTGAAPAPGVMPISGQNPQDIYGFGTYEKYMKQGLGAQQAGIAGEAKAIEAQGQQEAAALQAQQAQEMKRQQDYEAHVQELAKERESFIQDIKDEHIDPNHYLGSKSSLGKGMTAIGLILGGLGSGGGPNQALGFLQKQIDNDIDSQKAQLGKKQTLLSMNLQQYKNMQDAEQMTRMQMHDLFKSKLEEIGAANKGTIAGERAKQASGLLTTQMAGPLSQMAARRTMMSGSPGSEVAPEFKIKTFLQGPEQSAALKDLDEARVQKKEFDHAMSIFDEVDKLQTPANRLGSPIQTSSKIHAAVNPLIAALSKATAGKFTEADSGMLEPLLPKVTDDAQTRRYKRAKLQQLVQEKMVVPSTLSAIGINPFGQGTFKMNGENKIKLGPVKE